MRRTTLLLSVSLFWSLSACSDDDPPPAGPPVDGGALPPDEVSFTVLSWNVGNGVDSDPVYGRRIASRSYEEHVGTRIRELGPDLIGLQEVLSPFRCAGIDEQSPSRACFGVTVTNPPVRRLLGDGYSIACDQNEQATCIAVRVGFGRIRGVEPGGLALMGAETPPLPYPKCSATSCRQGGAAECLDMTSVSTVLVDVDELGTIRVINVHAHPWGPPCRGEMVRDAFSLADDHPTLLLGDWNFEPYQIDRPAGHIWTENVGPGRRFDSHHPFDARGRAIPTKGPRSLGRLVSDFARGLCEVRSDPPLHAGFDFVAAGIPEEADRQPDHFAVICPLDLRR